MKVLVSHRQHYLLAAYPQLLNPVLGGRSEIFLLRKAGTERTEGQAGGVTFVQRFGTQYMVSHVASSVSYESISASLKLKASNTTDEFLLSQFFII